MGLESNDAVDKNMKNRKRGEKKQNKTSGVYRIKVLFDCDWTLTDVLFGG